MALQVLSLRGSSAPGGQAVSVKVEKVLGLRLEGEAVGQGTTVTVQLHLLPQDARTAEVMAETKNMGNFTNIIFDHEFMVEVLQHQRLVLHVARGERGPCKVLLGSGSIPLAGDGYPQVSEDQYLALQPEYDLQEHEAGPLIKNYCPADGS